MSQEQRPVMVVDAYSLFTRAYCAYPTMNTDGEAMGGCIGFLKTLRRLVYEMQPTNVYICWESGGSQRRRSLYPAYKMNRKPEKLNRFYEDDIPDSEENKNQQVIKLLNMLKCVPVHQIYIPNCEADDVVAYLCRGTFVDRQKVIISSDRDMYQLLDDKTRLYALHKKTYVVASDVLDEFRVHVKNFALAKALCGDPSDNVPGIKGMGFKTVAKVFPFLGNDCDVLVEDVISYAHAHIDESKFCRKVCEQESDVKRNWKLVYLDGSMLSATQQQTVDRVVANSVPKSNRVGLIKLLAKEGINDIEIPWFFDSFNCIDGMQLASGDA